MQFLAATSQLLLAGAGLPPKKSHLLLTLSILGLTSLAASWAVEFACNASNVAVNCWKACSLLSLMPLNCSTCSRA